MAREKKYGIRELRRDFPTDDACLDIIFQARHSTECSCGGTYTRIKGRRQYQCSKCRYQIAPTAGTIFHKSETPLTMWFAAISLFSNAKSGLSAKQLERDLNVGYKTAWRMLMLIRKSLKQSTHGLQGDVEMDETYFGGKGKGGINNKNLGDAMKSKSVISGAVERYGALRAQVSENGKAHILGQFLLANVDPRNTRLLTDESNRYDKIAREFHRESVNHAKKEYVRGDVHVNTIEGWWGHLKTSVRGTHKAISKKYLPAYLEGFVFHYNNRHNDNVRFARLLSILLHAPRLYGHSLEPASPNS